MKIRILALGLAASLLALPALADNIDGKWTATVDGGPNGPVTLNFEFKAEGEKLTGTLAIPMAPAPTPISDGAVKGDAVTFKLSLAMMQGAPPIVIDYKGTLKGDEVNLVSVMDMGGQKMETPLLLKRAK